MAKNNCLVGGVLGVKDGDGPGDGGAPGDGSWPYSYSFCCLMQRPTTSLV